jgi:hypothetical protein
MKIEIMTNGDFKDLQKHYKFNANRVYKTPKDINNEHPYFEIWEIEKSDLRSIEETCLTEDVWMCYAKGSNMGTPFEPLTINGQFVIGWTTNNKEDTFDCLSEYFMHGLGITNDDQICAGSSTLAKTNGWSLNKTWKMLEG